MQYYASLFRTRSYKIRKQNSKLKQIRKLLLSGLRPEIMVLLIAAVIFPEMVSTLRR